MAILKDTTVNGTLEVTGSSNVTGDITTEGTISGKNLTSSGDITATEGNIIGKKLLISDESNNINIFNGDDDSVTMSFNIPIYVIPGGTKSITTPLSYSICIPSNCIVDSISSSYSGISVGRTSNGQRW